MQELKEFIKSMGELRLMLTSLALFSLANIPFTDTSVRMEGWGLLPDVLMPVVTVIVVFVTLLDMLMSRVFMAEASEETRTRFRRIFWFELMVVTSLVLCWMPYLLKVLG